MGVHKIWLVGRKKSDYDYDEEQEPHMVGFDIIIVR